MTCIDAPPRNPRKGGPRDTPGSKATYGQVTWTSHGDSVPRGPLIPTFANAPAETARECWNRTGPPASFCGATRRNDLIGLFAGQFRHMVEPEREAADAGGRRANLHDEVADFRLRHHRPHDIPAAPPFAGVEAENLPA